MTVRVSSTMVIPAAAFLRPGEPMSVTRVAHPLAVGTNHLLGHVLGGLRHHQVCGGTPSSTTPTARVVIHRHPNCDYLVVVIKIGAVPKDAWSISVTAGNGDTVTYEGNTEVPAYSRLRILAPWGSADADDKEVVISATDCSIRTLAIYDQPRVLLDPSTEDGVDQVDSTYPRIALLPERYIADSLEAGPAAIIQSIADAWDDYQPTLWSWWSPTALSVSATSSGGSGSSSDFFGGAAIKAQNRERKAADTTRTARVWLRTYGAGTVTGYTVKVSSNSDSVTSARTNTSASWESAITGLDVRCDTYDDLVIEGWRTGGSGSVYLIGASVIGDST